MKKLFLILVLVAALATLASTESNEFSGVKKLLQKFNDAKTQNTESPLMEQVICARNPNELVLCKTEIIETSEPKNLIDNILKESTVNLMKLIKRISQNKPTLNVVTKVECPNGQHIAIDSASVSNMDRSKCIANLDSNWLDADRKLCREINETTKLLMQLCDGKNNCEFSIDEDFADMCKCAAQKYLEFKYECLEPEVLRTKRSLHYRHVPNDRKPAEVDPLITEAPLQERRRARTRRTLIPQTRRTRMPRTRRTRPQTSQTTTNLQTTTPSGSGESGPNEYDRNEYLGGEYLGGEYLGGEYLGGEYLGGEYLGGEYLGGEYYYGEYYGNEYGEYNNNRNKDGLANYEITGRHHEAGLGMSVASPHNIRNKRQLTPRRNPERRLRGSRIIERSTEEPTTVEQTTVEPTTVEQTTEEPTSATTPLLTTESPNYDEGSQEDESDVDEYYDDYHYDDYHYDEYYDYYYLPDSYDYYYGYPLDYVGDYIYGAGYNDYYGGLMNSIGGFGGWGDLYDYVAENFVPEKRISSKNRNKNFAGTRG